MSTARKWFIGGAIFIALVELVLIVLDPSALGNWLTLVAMLILIVSQVLQARAQRDRP